MQSAEQARAALDRLEADQRDMPRRLRNARAAKARADFEAAHGVPDPWTLRGTEDDVNALEARAVALPGLIQKARVRVAEAELEDVTAELEALEAGEAERQEELSRTAAELRRARDTHERAREADSSARQRIAAIRAGIKPYRQNVLDQLTNEG